MVQDYYKRHKEISKDQNMVNKCAVTNCRSGCTVYKCCTSGFILSIEKNRYQIQIQAPGSNILSPNTLNTEKGVH